MEKIDKRTKVYRDSRRPDTGGSDVRTDPVDVDILDQPKPLGVAVNTTSTMEANEVLDKPPLLVKPDNSICMHCGDPLPPNEDGTKKYYRHQTPCDVCVNKNKTKAIINGKEFTIDPTDPPKPHFEEGKATVYKDSKGKVYA